MKSTYDEFIESMTKKEREEFEAEYKELLLSELLIALMNQDGISVRRLAKAAGISPSLIQGKKKSKSTFLKKLPTQKSSD